jgi:hypothetical protein
VKAFDAATLKDGLAGYKLAKENGARLKLLTPEEALQWKQAINSEAIMEETLKQAEAAGYKNARQIMDKMVKATQDADTKNPQKTILEQFLAQK